MKFGDIVVNNIVNIFKLIKKNNSKYLVGYLHAMRPLVLILP